MPRQDGVALLIVDCVPLPTMNFQGLVVLVPNGCTVDMHICGMCKAQFYVMSQFIEHKIRGCAINSEETENAEPPFELSQPGNQLGNHYEATETSDKTSGRIEPTTFKTVPNASAEPLIIGTDGNLHLASQVANLLASHVEHSAEETCPIDMKLEKKQMVVPEVFLIQESELGKIPTGGSNSENWGEYRGKKRSRLQCTEDGCNYYSYLKKDIERHARVHTGERPFKCSQCNKMFTRSDKLQIHQRIHSGDKRYKCSQCDYAAVESGSLTKHLRVHNDQRPFKCQLCSYRSRDKSQLTVHLRMHTGDSPFVCAYEKCKSAFKTNSDLKRHRVVHLNTKAFECPFCPFKSAVKGRIDLHTQKKHPNEEEVLKISYFCPHCEKVSFPTKRKLSNHMKKEHPQQGKCTIDSGMIKTKKKKAADGQGVLSRDFKCKQCQASFVCEENLRIHEIQHKSENIKFEKEKLIYQETIKTPVKEPKQIFYSQNGGEKYMKGCLPNFPDGTKREREVSYLETGELDVNLRTAEMLASFAEVSAVYFPPDDDLHNPHGGKFM